MLKLESHSLRKISQLEGQIAKCQSVFNNLLKYGRNAHFI